MIYVVTCTCGGADRTAREALRNGGVENPIEYPIYKGKKEAKAVVTQLISRFGPSADLGALLDYIEKAGRFVVVTGMRVGRGVGVAGGAGVAASNGGGVGRAA